MIITGLLILLLGLLLNIGVLTTVGLVVAIVGLILMVLGHSGRTVGGRAHYW